MVVRALDYLAALGAIDEHGRLTPDLGEQLAEMPTDPSIAKIVSVAVLPRFCSALKLIFVIRSAHRVRKVQLRQRNPFNIGHDVRV